jgi:tRNA-splicing ligase RtcB (3'-phosphate/5'-hydroxy nucleic acid ligase)
MNIRTFGPVDERSLTQLERCMAAGDADYGVLCADHHPGYSQPIGGAIAYEGYVSPSGVGYDIGCVAVAEPVLCTDGASRPIEQARDPLCADADGTVRPVAPFLGVVARGRRATVTVTLSNHRSVTVTPDHQILTDVGWRRADELREGDRALCPVFLGWPHDDGCMEPALLRLAGYVNGDGHLATRGSRDCLYTSRDSDAEDLIQDMRAVGANPSRHRRLRPNGSIENAVYANDRSLRERLEALGCLVGRKAGQCRGSADAILQMPAYARACYVSAFASAEMSTPRLAARRIPNLAIKQRGIDAIEQVADLLASLRFRVGISRSDGENWVAQILGGEEEQIRFIETVGFCRARDKRLAGAAAVATAWERSLEATVQHLAYHGGALRPAPSRCPVDAAVGECVHSDVVSVEPAGEWETYDIGTADPAEAFVAGGIVVHNCGNKAVQTELTRADLEDLGGVGAIMERITQRISFGMGVPARERVEHPVLDKIRNAEFAPQRKLAGVAESQLGTVGSGNHYVNVMEDEGGHVWVGVHFGSRGFGHKTASGFLALAQGLAFDDRAREGEMDSPPVLLGVGTELGDAYVAAMELAGEYAYAGRDVVVAKVLEVLSAEAVHEVHNHHNFAWREEHGGRTYWVVRKGCTPAQPGQEGFVGGSMGDESVILEGVASEEAEDSLYSTVHGAGRVMSRTQAAGKVRRRKRWACGNRECDRLFESADARCPEHPGSRMLKTWVQEQVRPGVVDWPAVQARLRDQGIVLMGGGADEAPEVYKRLPDVLAAHAGSIRVTHRLRPLGVAMAGRDIHDPYKD